MGIRTGSGLSTDPDPRSAARLAAEDAAAELDGPADLVLTFLSGAHLARPEEILGPIHEVLRPTALAGCGAAGVVGSGREVTGETAVSVWAAVLDGGFAEGFHAGLLETEEGMALAGMPDPEGASALLLFPDPYSMPTDALLRALDESCPGTVVLGGLPSARTLDGNAALLWDGGIAGSGVAGVVLRDVDVDACVSQGASPLGPELTITAAEGHVIHELAGRPALARIHLAIGELHDHDRDLVDDGLLLGIVADPGHAEYEQGDFVVRGILGADPATGAVTVGAEVQPGQVVRLHARDPAAADDDLERALRGVSADGEPPAGALVFTCQSRGPGLFADASHDAQAVARAFPGAAAAGFHAAGEIGPIGDRSFLHGFTATVAVFRP